MRSTFLNEEHRAAVTTVLAAKAKLAQRQRTVKMIETAIGKGKHQRDALDTANQQVTEAVYELKRARLEYGFFFIRNERFLIEFWRAVDLLDIED